MAKSVVKNIRNWGFRGLKVERLNGLKQFCGSETEGSNINVATTEKMEDENDYFTIV